MALTKVSTDGVKDDAITSGKIPANAVGSSEIQDGNVIAAKLATSAVQTAKIADDAVTMAKIANGAVGTNQIADQAVTLAKLEHGTSSNDGKFLRANNGADPTFETVSGTTINNNADNRVITGSGTANTLEGESSLTYTGSVLNVNSPSISTDAKLIVKGNDTNDHDIITAYANTSTRGSFAIRTGSGISPSFLIGTRGSNETFAFMTNGAERVRVTDNGLTFNGDTAEANALNDYEEGEATMTAYSNPYVNISSTYNKMDYTKIGNVVTITGLIQISGVSSTSYFRINLPFTSVNHGNPRRSDSIGVVMHNNVNTGDAGLVCYLPMGSSVLNFYKVNDNSSWSILTNSDLASSDEMYFTITYKTA